MVTNERAVNLVAKEVKHNPKNPGFFSKDIEARAKRVKRVHLVKEKYTGEIGELLVQKPGLLEKGWLKVKWQNRDKPTLIQRSEVVAVKAKRNPGGRIARITKAYIRRYGDSGQVKAYVEWIDERGKAGTTEGKGNPVGTHMRALLDRAKREGIKIERQEWNPSQGGSGAGATSSDVRSPTRTSTEVRSPTKTSTVAHTRGNITVTGGAGAGATTSVIIKRARKNPEADTQSARELVLYIESDSELYRRQGLPIIKNLIAKKARGIYDTDKAAKLYMYLTESGAKKYAREFDSSANWNKIFDKPTRLEAARELVRGFENEAATGAYDNFLPKKYQKKNPSVNPDLSGLSETFQGKASGAVSEYKASNSAPANLARIGKLVFLKLRDKRAQIVPPGAMVAVDTRGKLWLVGKRSMFQPKAKAKGLLNDYGEVERICYLTAKQHIGPDSDRGKPTEYVHTFGENGGARPHLLVDHEGMPILRGGDYQIKAEGIVN